MKYVPIVALVPENVARIVADYAAAPEAQAVTTLLAPETMARNGWTPEMVMAGVLLRVGAEATR